MKQCPSDESAKREKRMKAHYKVAGMTSMLLLLAFSLL